MIWNDLMALVEHAWAEDIDSTTAFAKREMLKLEAANKQTEASRRIKCLEYSSYYTIPLTVGTQLHNLPADFLLAKKVRYQDLWFLGQLYAYPEEVSISNSQPKEFWIQDKKIGFNPPESTAAMSAYLWYLRVAPPYAFLIKETNGDSTACTFTVTASAFSFTITGGANAGTQTIDITSATYDTIGELVARINALNKGVTATRMTICDTLTACSNLEVIAAVNIHGTANEARVYLNPELPEEMQRPILGEWMLGIAREKDRQYTQANVHFSRVEASINYYKKEWKDRFVSIGPRTKTPYYAGGAHTYPRPSYDNF